jgi:hypothetical protein
MGWGGSRPGAGRKKSINRVVREMAADQACDDAKYSLGLHAHILRDESMPIELRLACGEHIENRAWGKYLQTNKDEHGGELTIRVVYGQGDTAAPSGVASGTEAIQG